MNDFKLLLDEQNSKIIGQKSLSLIKKKEHNSKKKKITKKNNIEKRQDKTVQPKPSQVSTVSYKLRDIDKEALQAARRIIPDAAFQVEQERELRKIATRGVVLLFNQIAERQKTST